jgi:hypothetical protein
MQYSMRYMCLCEEAMVISILGGDKNSFVVSAFFPKELGFPQHARGAGRLAHSHCCSVSTQHRGCIADTSIYTTRSGIDHHCAPYSPTTMIRENNIQSGTHAPWSQPSVLLSPEER